MRSKHVTLLTIPVSLQKVTKVYFVCTDGNKIKLYRFRDVTCVQTDGTQGILTGVPQRCERV
jgi:hypothetical protein